MMGSKSSFEAWRGLRPNSSWADRVRPIPSRLKENPDGSLTLYIQKDSPGKERESNWLPAPDGPIYMVIRLYWPKDTPPSVLPPGEGSWHPPGIEPVIWGT